MKPTVRSRMGFDARILVFAAVLISCFAATPLIRAQSQWAVLTGTVFDPEGAVVPGTLIQIQNEATGEQFRSTSGVNGDYVIPLVKPGMYSLTAEVTGFKRHTQSGILLETGIRSRVDVRLEVGGITEVVTVEASVPLLQSESAAVGLTVENRSIANMPLLDRRAAQLVKLSGFVVSRGSGSVFSSAGGPSDNAAWMVDGNTVQNNVLGVPTLILDPPIESLQEFNFSISTFAAELGRTGGAVIQMTTKSGTNEFHGSAYEFLRNDALDARTFFSAQKPVLRYNLFGASLGGPVVKNQTHFFFNFEGQRQITQTTTILNVPNPAETRGDFSGGGIVVRDPSALDRPPFPGSIIPASRLDPIGAQLASYYPAPNVAGRPSGSNNFLANRGFSYPSDTYVARVDHVFNGQNRGHGRLLRNRSDTLRGGVFLVRGTDPQESSVEQRYWNVSGTWIRNLRPAVLNELRLGWDRRTRFVIDPSVGSGLGEKLNIPGVDNRRFPRVRVVGLAALGYQGNENAQDPLLQVSLVDNLTLVRGSHTVKIGGEYRGAWIDGLTAPSRGGLFDFNNLATGASLASLLLGWTQSAQRDDGVLTQPRTKTLGFFVQDDWKVTPRLALNLGLRWDYDEPRWEAQNRQNSFDRAAINPVSGTPGIVAFSGRDGLGKFAHNHDLNNFGPRFGFVWRHGENWVLRGGGAIVYMGQYDTGVPQVLTLGFGRLGQFVSPDNGLTPALLLRQGLPPIPPGEELGPAFGAVRVGASPRVAVSFLEPSGRRNPYTERFSFTVQRQIRVNLLAEAAYLGTLGHKLTPADDLRTINQIPPELMGPGNAQARRPFPQFSNVSVLAAAIGNSNYHAMNLKLEKRYSGGLQFQVNYTWSRNIADVASRDSLGADSSFFNYYDRSADRGLAGNHLSQRFVSSVVWDLPFGAGRRVALGRNAALNGIAGGWTIGFFAEIRSGTPYRVVEQVNRANAFSAANRPNVVGNSRSSGSQTRDQRLQSWFNTAAFVAPPDFTFGNAGADSGYGPGAVAMDLSILKNFRFLERHRIQVRLEALNFLNHPNFAGPNTQRGHPSFGTITGLAPGTQARVVQSGLRYSF